MLSPGFTFEPGVFHYSIEYRNVNKNFFCCLSAFVCNVLTAFLYHLNLMHFFGDDLE